MRDTYGRFTAGTPAENRCAVGAVRIRTRHKRGEEQRAFIKVAEPNTWVLRARFVWEQSNGPIPPGHGIHHRDGDKLNDELANLEMVSKADHIRLHSPAYRDVITEKFIAARRAIRWSTRSATKRTGRPPSWDDETIIRAVGTYFVSDRTVEDVATEFGLTRLALGAKVREAKRAILLHS